ncbi:hypothetical protein TIFTF001_023516 [Ficus carica]|uniref:UBC core domain-containing protein n=1 Tax=Ficus carica TaxID=3494 RepID=A0AA88AJR6_FICCA|nr:hypothetical protein TIFTF001_023516 [Ficus carica]
MIAQETQRLLSEPAPGISASPSEDNMRYFNVMILGPTQSPYEVYVFWKVLGDAFFFPLAVNIERSQVISFTYNGISHLGVDNYLTLRRVIGYTVSMLWLGVILLRYLCSALLVLFDEYCGRNTKISTAEMDSFWPGKIRISLSDIFITGGVFKLELFLPEEYPMAAPKPRYLPSQSQIVGIQALLSAPNPDDPLSENIAKHWKTNEAEAVETAKEWTRLYASGA